MTPQDWTLLVIAAGSQPLQPVQLQKALFLLGRSLGPEAVGTETYYQFEAYDYGPFSRSVYDDAEALESDGLVTIARPPETRFKSYSATDTGRDAARRARASLDPAVSGYVDRLVAWVQSLTFNQLVRAVYAAHPEMRANSVFQEFTA